MDSKVPIAGAILASLGSGLSWLCCLPLALSLLGAGTATLAAFVAPFRPYLVGLSVFCLGAGFYGLYGPESHCQGDRCPLPEVKRRQRMMLWIATGVTVIVTTIGYWGSWVIYWTL